MADHTDSFMQRAESRIGSILRDKWRLDRLLGVGGMAAVYAATHRNGKRGAVKLLHPAIAHDPDARSRFLREGYVANRIGHPGVVAVLDDDVTEDGGVFLVMELLAGQSVDSLIDASPNQRLDPRLAVDIACQLLDVLNAAHAQGVVHRDLKPDNLFMTQQNLVKVLDFGIARLRDANNDNRTQTGSVMGTPAFMPPEQALGDWNRVDHRSDLWAAGATLFAMLAGHHVHQAETVNKLLLAAMTKHAPPLASAFPGVHPELARIVDKSLAFEPEKRFQSALEMRLALLSLHDDAPTTIAPAFNPQLAATIGQPDSLLPLASRASAAPAKVTLAVPIGDSWQPAARSHRDGTLSAASRSGTFTQPPGQKSYVAAIALTCLILAGGAGFFVWKLNASSEAAGAASGTATPRRESPATGTASAPVLATATATAEPEPMHDAPQPAASLSASASASTPAATSATASAPATTAPKIAPHLPAAKPPEPTAAPSVRTPGNFDGRY